MNPDDEEKEPDTLTRIVLDSLPKKKVLSKLIKWVNSETGRYTLREIGNPPTGWDTGMWYEEDQFPADDTPTTKELTDSAYGQLSVRV